MQDGRDGDEEVGYIANITDSTTIGFKYFDCHDIREISIWIRGYADGTFEVKTAWDGEVLATLEVQYTNVWEKYTAPVTIRMEYRRYLTIMVTEMLPDHLSYHNLC